MAPGPVLAAYLSSFERSTLSGHDLVVVMQAQARQLAHDQAELLATMAAVAAAAAGNARPTAAAAEFAADEIRAALTLTRRAADAELDLALSMERLPEVWQALRSGDIDVRRARVLANGTDHLPPREATAVASAALQPAAHMTTGELAAHLRKLCLAVDPEDAEHRYRSGVTDRRVGAQPNPDGTADLYALQLPPQRVQAILRRINEIARSLDSARDDRTIDQRRADVVLDLLEGADFTSGKGGVVDLRVDLTTLMQLSETPGEIPGWGPVIADIARQVAADQMGAEWRTTVTDSATGGVVWDGTTRRRPTAGQTRHVQARRQSCVFPGCRMPARSCDLDHTVAWAQGGPTTTANLAPLCAHDHRLKHEGGWHLAATGSGQYTRTSLLGHTYTATGIPP